MPDTSRRIVVEIVRHRIRLCDDRRPAPLGVLKKHAVVACRAETFTELLAENLLSIGYLDEGRSPPVRSE